MHLIVGGYSPVVVGIDWLFILCESDFCLHIVWISFGSLLRLLMCLSIYIAVTWLRVRGDCSPALEIKYTHLYHCRSGKEIHQKKKKKKKKKI